MPRDASGSVLWLTPRAKRQISRVASRLRLEPAIVAAIARKSGVIARRQRPGRAVRRPARPAAQSPLALTTRYQGGGNESTEGQLYSDSGMIGKRCARCIDEV